GANTLRCYLRYSAALSQGDEVAARAALRAVSRGSDEHAAVVSEDATTRAIAGALRARGWLVSEAVGGSRFRCDLAIRGANDAEHRLAVLVDTEGHYQSGDLDERYRVKPALLRAFNWRVEAVLAKDWRDSPAETLARIEDSLKA